MAHQSNGASSAQIINGLWLGTDADRCKSRVLKSAAESAERGRQLRRPYSYLAGFESSARGGLRE
jgi:hypothetical protein